MNKKAMKLAVNKGAGLSQKQIENIIADAQGDMFVAITESYCLGFKKGCEKGVNEQFVAITKSYCLGFAKGCEKGVNEHEVGE